jgi:plasmid stability protein
MRTTFNIDEALLRRLKLEAADSGRSLSEVTEEAIRAFLVPRAEGRSKPVVVPVSRHDLGLRGGVDLDSNASIAETMDEEQMEKMRANARR